MHSIRPTAPATEQEPWSVPVYSRARTVVCPRLLPSKNRGLSPFTPYFDDYKLTDERKVQLNQLLELEKDYLKYVYDFGDNWSHRITLEKILPYDPQLALPVCVKAKGACPPEDVGGIWGYYELLDALRDPQHPSHAEYAEWIGDEFTPDAYDLVEVNARLQALCR